MGYTILRFFCILCLLGGSSIGAQPLQLERNWQEYQITKAHGIGSMLIPSILQDHQGRIWLGTQKTIDRLDMMELKNHQPNTQASGLSGYGFQNLVMDSANNVLYASSSEGVFSLDLTQDAAIFQRISFEKAQPGRISALYVSQGFLWIGSDRGLFEYSIREGTCVQWKGAGFDNIIIHQIIKIGNTLLLTGDEGLIQISISGSGSGSPKTIKEGRNCRITLFGNRLYWSAGTQIYESEVKEDGSFNSNGDTSFSISIGNEINDLAYDKRQKRLLICTNEGLQVRHKKGGQWNIEIEQKYRDADVLCAFVDKAGSYWIGVSQLGIMYVNAPIPGIKYFSIPSTSSMGSIRNAAMNRVWAFAEQIDENDNIWLFCGTDNGVYRWNRSASKISMEALLPDQHVVLSMLFDPKTEILWVGTEDGDLFRIKHPSSPKPVVDQQLPPKSLGKPIKALQKDSKERLWVGLADVEGNDPEAKSSWLYVLDEPEATTITANKVPTPNSMQGAYTIFGYNNDMYVGDLNSNITKFDNELNSVNFPRVGKLNGNPILFIDAHGKDSLIVGTFFDGLYRISMVSDPSIEMRRDLPSYMRFTSIYSALIGSKDDLWLSTGDGVHTISSIDGKLLQSYDPRHGLQGEDFNKNAYLKSQDGSIFLGGGKGFNQIIPDSIRPDTGYYFSITEAISENRETIGNYKKGTAYYIGDALSLKLLIHGGKGTSPFRLIYPEGQDMFKVRLVKNRNGNLSDSTEWFTIEKRYSIPSNSLSEGEWELQVEMLREGRWIPVKPFKEASQNLTVKKRILDTDWFRGGVASLILGLLGLAIWLLRQRLQAEFKAKLTGETNETLIRLIEYFLQDTREPDRIVDAIFQVAIQRNLGAHLFAIGIERDGWIRYYHYYEDKILKQDPQHAKVPVGFDQKKSLSSLVFKNGVGYPIYDVDNDYPKEITERATKDAENIPFGAKAGSILMLPLKKADGSCFGTITFQDKKKGEYKEAHFEFAKQLADIVSYSYNPDYIRDPLIGLWNRLEELENSWESLYGKDVQSYHAPGGLFRLQELPPHYRALFRFWNISHHLWDQLVDTLCLKGESGWPDNHPIGEMFKGVKSDNHPNATITPLWVVTILIAAFNNSQDPFEVEDLSQFNEGGLFYPLTLYLQNGVNATLEPDRALIVSFARGSQIHTDKPKTIVGLSRSIYRLFTTLIWDNLPDPKHQNLDPVHLDLSKQQVLIKFSFGEEKKAGRFWDLYVEKRKGSDKVQSNSATTLTAKLEREMYPGSFKPKGDDRTISFLFHSGYLPI